MPSPCLTNLEKNPKSMLSHLGSGWNEWRICHIREPYYFSIDQYTYLLHDFSRFPHPPSIHSGNLHYNTRHCISKSPHHASCCSENRLYRSNRWEIFDSPFHSWSLGWIRPNKLCLMSEGHQGHASCPYILLRNTGNSLWKWLRSPPAISILLNQRKIDEVCNVQEAQMGHTVDFATPQGLYWLFWTG